MSVKSRIHAILEKPPGEDRTAFIVQATLAVVILLNTILVVIYTVPEIEHDYGLVLDILITACLLVFAAEYILRLWSCTEAPTLRRRTAERLRYATGFFMIIDLISIIPLAFPFLFPRDFALLRTFRLLSIFKLGRYARNSESLGLLKRVILKKREIFTIMIFFLVFIILFSSTIMYFVEYSAQPDKFSSIPAAMWWAMMTVTTVGYGDIVPITALGKVLASVITLAGVLLLALPSAILAAGFIEEKQKERELFPGMSPEKGIELLERLSALKENGNVSEDEFETLRQVVLREYSGGEDSGQEIRGTNQ